MKSTTLVGIIFLLPALIVIGISIAIPSVWNIVLSFQSWNGFLDSEWVALENYIRAFEDNYVKDSLYNSFFLGIGSTIGAVVIGILLALLIFRLGNFEGALYRLIFFTPVMLPLAIVGLLFTFVFNPEMGLLNQFFSLIGVESLQQAWLSNPKTVMWALIFVGAWRLVGLTMMLCFASMIAIPKDLFEAARIDGAGYVRQSFMIILPLIKPIIQLSAVYTLVISLKTYDLVYVMTRGGPGTVSQTIPIYMMETAFTYGEFGYAATLGLLFTIAGLLLIFLVHRLLKGEQYEY